MNKNISNLLFFVAGAAIGAVAMWKVVKTKYERIANEEIESVKEVFSRKREAPDGKLVEFMNELEREIFSRKKDTSSNYVSPAEAKAEACKIVEDYKTILQENDYDCEEDYDMNRPYVIPPDEFGECEYDTVTLTYYPDGVLTDELDEIIYDVDGVVGEESLKHFGEFEDDSVCVRNDRDKTDYEILLDPRNYSDCH